MRTLRPILALLILAAGPVADVAAEVNPFHDAIARARQRCAKIYGGGAGREHGYATGLIVSPDGLILTAQGMFLSEERVRVLLPDGSRHAAEIVRRSDALQAALLKIDAATPDHFTLSRTSPVREGDWVLAVSNAFNVAGPREPLAANLGVVSLRAELEARHRRQDVPYEGDVLLIDAITSNPGAPGGAVVTADGHLAGMIGKIFLSPNTNTRINYAVPVERLHAFVALPSQEGGGDETPGGTPYLGIRLFTLSGKRAPAYVDRIEAGSPAAEAGVRKDDLVLAVGRNAVRTCEQYDEALAELVPGRAVTLLLKRGQRVLTLSVTPARKEATE
jgi:serine protease Do